MAREEGDAVEGLRAHCGVAELLHEHRLVQAEVGPTREEVRVGRHATYYLQPNIFLSNLTSMTLNEACRGISQIGRAKLK